MHDRLKSRVPDAQLLFFLGFLLSGSGLLSPPIALLSGIAYGLTLHHPFRRESGRLAMVLLQVSVVLLGFGMNLREVLRAGRSGFVYTAVGIGFAMLLGLGLGRLLRVRGNSAFLIAVGTAICGGSAIAAAAPIVGANEEEMSVSMGTVFFLNSIALLIFPAIGVAMHLSQRQFGLWAALAIHDTSSVVGAAAKFGSGALAVGTTVKLARALWIIPVSLLTAAVVRRSREDAQESEYKTSFRVKIPWFILLFALASVVRTYAPALQSSCDHLSQLGRQGMTATLFVIGTGFSGSALKRVGVRPLMLGVILWVVVASASLIAIVRLGLE